jgi:hypothetical protein
MSHRLFIAFRRHRGNGPTQTAFIISSHTKSSARINAWRCPITLLPSGASTDKQCDKHRALTDSHTVQSIVYCASTSDARPTQYLYFVVRGTIMSFALIVSILEAVVLSKYALPKHFVQHTSLTSVPALQRFLKCVITLLRRKPIHAARKLINTIYRTRPGSIAKNQTRYSR